MRGGYGRLARKPRGYVMAGIGHNSRDNASVDVLNTTAQRQLKSILQRIERLEVEKAEVNECIKEVYAEAKGNGFDVKILRKMVRLLKQDQAKRQEEEAILDLYLSAVGELPDTEDDDEDIA